MLMSRKFFLLVFLIFGLCQFSTGQCPDNNVQYGTTDVSGWNVGSSNTLTSCLYGGEYRLITNLIPFALYSFETCGDTDFDTQITVYDDATGSQIAYNDDFCGAQSQVQFVSNGNPVKVLIDRSFCADQISCMTLRGSLVQSQYTGPKTYVPDDNFEAYLEANGMGDGIPFNDSVYTSSITDVQNLTVSGLSIADLTGIVGFTSLEILFCDSNELTNLNLINNTALIQVYCSENQLANIEVAGLNNLEILNCSFNQLPIIDFSGLSNLQVFDCSQNLLSSLDVSNLNLTDLNCSDNLLSTINVDGLYCEFTFDCSNNLLTSLDFSNAFAEQFSSDFNNLSYLNLQNGTNTSISWGMSSIGNPNLYCIQVDDPAWSYANWSSGIDPHMAFSSDCSVKTYVPDDSFENYLETHDRSNQLVPLGDVSSMGDGIANNDSVYTANISTVDTLWMPGSDLVVVINDLTGLEDFTALKVLEISYNWIGDLSLNDNVNLEYFYCSMGGLSSLDLSSCMNLKILFCDNNSFLTTLNIPQSDSLELIECQINQLNSLDLSGTPNLDYFDCSYNQLTYLDLRNGNNTNCTYSSLNNPDLTCVYVDDPIWSTTNWTNIDVHTSFYGNLPNVNAGSDQTFCVGTSVTLNGSGATSYSWDNGVTDGVPFIPITGTTIYTVTGADGNGCSATDQVQINSLELNVFPVDTFICLGDSVILNSEDNYSIPNEGYNGPSWHVCNGGSDITGDGSVTNPFETINYAISVASNFDTVYVAAGTYYENVLIDKDLVFLGAGIQQTIIDAGNNGFGINAIQQGGINIHIEGFSVTNASQGFGAITVNGNYCNATVNAKIK